METTNLSRKKRIEIYGSENFTQEPSITADGIFSFSPAPQKRISKYLPADEITVQNNSNSNLELLLNGTDSRKYVVKAGTVRSFDSTDILPFNRYKLKELSGEAVSQGDVTIDVRRSGADSDKLARQKAQRSPADKIVKKVTGLSLGDMLNGR